MSFRAGTWLYLGKWGRCGCWVKSQLLVVIKLQFTGTNLERRVVTVVHCLVCDGSMFDEGCLKSEQTIPSHPFFIMDRIQSIASFF